MSTRTYPAKILLVGEYAVLKGSPFLLTPYPMHYSEWSCDIPAHPKWAEFTEYLIKECSEYLNTQEILRDIKKGWTVDLKIPTGYGIGSSGSLCAAIYDRYKRDDENNLTILKSRLAQMENYFHGNSSGLDPLVSLLNQSILGQQKEIKTLEFNLSDFPQITLIDSGLARSTATFVDIFHTKLESLSFQSALTELIRLNAELINALINNDVAGSSQIWKSISTLQLEHFTEMIPSSIHKAWEKELNAGTAFYKLCGAGGGGYFLKWEETPLLTGK